MGTGKVVICYATSGSNRDLFTRSLYRFARYDARQRNILLDDYCVGVGPYIDWNENTMIRHALETDAEWIFSVETDVGFHETIPYHLLDWADPVERPIMSAIVVGRQAAKTSDVPGDQDILVPMFFLKDEPTGMYRTVARFETEGPMKLDACGLGCVMIHRSVFEAFHKDGPRVWFKFGTYPDAKNWMAPLGQDIYFCQEAQKLGFTIWGDAQCQTMHEKSEILTVDKLQRETVLAQLRRVGG